MTTKNKLIEIFVDARQLVLRHQYLMSMVIEKDPRWIALMEEVGWEEILKNLPTLQEMAPYAKQVMAASAASATANVAPAVKKEKKPLEGQKM